MLKWIHILLRLEFINYDYYYRKAFVFVSSFASSSSVCSTVSSCKRLTKWLALVFFTLDIMYLSINYVIFIYFDMAILIFLLVDVLQ